MIVLITLTVAGTNTGPFDLYSDTDGFTTPFETSVSKAALVAGYLSTLVPNGSTIIRVQSAGTCTNYVDINIVQTTTTTTSSSTSTTTTSSTSTTTTSTSTSTTTTTTTLTPASCGEFTLEGGDGSGRTFNYTDCNGNVQSVTVPGGDAQSDCIQLPYGAPGAVYIGPCGQSTLTFQYVGGDNLSGNGEFTFFLGSPLPLNLTIADAGIVAYDDGGCTTSTSTASQVGVATINAGNLSASAPSNSSVCTLAYAKVNSLTVDGNAVSNGSTLNIGGVTLNIVINTNCIPMPCVA